MADFVPDRYVWYGEPVSQIAAVSAAPPHPGAVCVFLILRGIGRESRAAWLPQRVFSRFGILDALNLDIAVITGFKVHITGGHSRHGSIACRHGDVLFFNFVPDDAEQEDTESESDAASDHTVEESAAGDNTEAADDWGDERADGGGNGTSPDAERVVVGSPGQHMQHAAPGYDSTTLLDMWNHDHVFSRAIRSGNQGDTPAGTSGNHISADYSIDASSFHRGRPLNQGSRGGGITSGILLYMAGMVLFRHIVPGASVILPTREFVTQVDSPLPSAGFDMPESYTLDSLCLSGSCNLRGHHSSAEWYPPLAGVWQSRRSLASLGRTLRSCWSIWSWERIHACHSFGAGER